MTDREIAQILVSVLPFIIGMAWGYAHSKKKRLAEAQKNG